MFKNEVRKVRLSKGLSQSQLANLVNLAEPNLSSIELGKREPWPKVRRDIAEVLGVPEEKLFPNERQ